MEFPDLPPKTDPKGGSPKTPIPPIRLDQLEEQDPPWQYPPRNGSVWKTIALCLIAMNLSGGLAFFTLGTDNVKHSEIDSILATRGDTVKHSELDTILTTRTAYSYDKARIQENFDALKKHADDLDQRVRSLEMSRDGTKR